MGRASIPLTERLAEIGGALQKIRWEALDMGYINLAKDIAHAIDAVAWAAGIYNSDANVIERSGVLPAAPNETPEITPVTSRKITNT